MIPEIRPLWYNFSRILKGEHFMKTCVKPEIAAAWEARIR